MSDPLDTLGAAFDRSLAYRRGLPEQRCSPRKGYREMLDLFDEALPETGEDSVAVIQDLALRGVFRPID